MDKNDKTLVGIGLRAIYDLFKESTKTEENESIFDFIESVGKEIRTHLEEDPRYENLYLGSDISRVGKEFLEAIDRALEEE